MKSYYHQHELAYEQIKTNGFVGWGNARTIAELGDAKTTDYLTTMVSKYFGSCQEKTALDVGCGTGTTAFTLRKLGFEVQAVDISNTAIEMGRELATQQNLDINFVVGDVLKLEELNKKFDLIYDSHCLHCIVLNEDRTRVLAGVKNSLASGGIFILDTMIMSDEKYDMIKHFGPLRFDEDYILWHKTKPSEARGVIEIKGQHWCAQRRIYPADKIISEVNVAGFKILAKQVDHQFEKPSMLRLVLSENGVDNGK